MPHYPLRTARAASINAYSACVPAFVCMNGLHSSLCVACVVEPRLVSVFIREAFVEADMSIELFSHVRDGVVVCELL